ncbi:AMP-binding protein [[Mycobacterium] zoologicum]|uniref:AMP-binding protein n=1 Tax=[Mycobacterium] zoologicum TaxID=2872311 RepID=UPI002C615AD0|nr:AMP-binding protein [Mycolicibacter sp. MYC101]MEB3065053.1 AMP-binding protein [Mycolicibacter sp. MYC101]
MLEHDRSSNQLDEPFHSWLGAGHTDTINDVIHRAAEKWPDRIYLDFSGDLWTYQQVYQRALAYAAGLAELGVRRGDTVATVLDNHIDAVTLWFAINFLGAISVPVNTANRGEFLRHQLDDSLASVVVAEADYAERVLGIADGIAQLQTLVCRGEKSDGAGLPFRIVNLDEIRLESADFAPVSVRSDELAVLIYTSGTTGPAKGCMSSHNYYCNVARRSNIMFKRTADSVVWSPMPLFHLMATATVVLATAQLGARAALLERFSVSNFWSEVERTGATEAGLIGAMVPLIATAPDSLEMKRCYGQLRVMGINPPTEEMAKTVRKRFGVQLVAGQVYAQSEATFITCPPPGEQAPAASAGRPNDDFEVRIFDDEDRDVPPGEVGEIVCRPTRPHVMFQGYWRRPDATLKVMRNLWLHTGDLGRFDPDGWLYFVDRKQDYMRHGGENISSQAVEEALAGHPAISEVAVHAVASELSEDDVKATVVLRVDAESLSPEEFFRWIVERVPRFALPRFIEFRDHLPLTPTGKVLKHVLRSEGVTETTWDRQKAGITVPRR